MEEKDIDFEEFYEKVRLKYSLPSFKEISEDFNIEKIDDKEPDFLIRDIRRAINEKLSAYMHFFESMINPASSSIFLFSMLRGVSDSDKSKMKEIYEQIARIQIDFMKLDLVYDEKKEADFVKRVFLIWQKMKFDILALVDNFGVNFDKDLVSKNDSYFD